MQEKNGYMFDHFNENQRDLNYELTNETPVE